MEDSVTLNAAEQQRLLILNDLEAGIVISAEAAELLGVSVRQVRRLRAAYRERGAAALAHGNRGHRPAHALDPAVAARVVELATSTYAGFNRQHLTEMLAEHHGIVLSRPTVHRILAGAGVASVRQRRPARHRQRRDRYPREGMLLQVDGSRHDWLEGRGPYLTLIGGIDDATGLVPWACFREQEDAQGYFQLFREVVRRRGIPMAVYSDQHSIFYSTKKTPTLEEQLTGRRTPTQVGRLLEELGVRWIRARSPQATGRVERLWGTFQDRLTSELRLADASTQEQASVVLERYLSRHNRRFTAPPADPTPAWLPWPRGRALHDVFCFKYQRRVANDNTVRLGAVVMDIPPNRQRISYARCRVDLHQRFDGTLHVFHNGIQLASASPPPSRLRDTRSQRPEPGRALLDCRRSRLGGRQIPPRTCPGSPPPTTHGAGEPAKITEPLAGQSH